jgi:hypothetical protein
MQGGFGENAKWEFLDGAAWELFSDADTHVLETLLTMISKQTEPKIQTELKVPLGTDRCMYLVDFSTMNMKHPADGREWMVRRISPMGFLRSGPTHSYRTDCTIIPEAGEETLSSTTSVELPRSFH